MSLFIEHKKYNEPLTFDLQVHDELMRAQESLSSAEAQLKKFSAAAAEMSWGLLTTVPPLVSAQPPRRISRRTHQTENWDDHRRDGQLTYFRPVLYSSYEGRVAQKAWVTNRATGYPAGIPGLFSRETGPDPKTDFPPKGPSQQTRSRESCRSREDECGDFVHVERETWGMQAVLSELLSHREEGEEGEGEGEGGIEEALPLFRLTNR